MLRRRTLWLLLFALPAQITTAQTIPAGSLIPVRIEHGITTETVPIGQHVSARIAKALKENGLVITPAGSELQGRVDFVARGNGDGDGWMRLVFTSLTLPDGRNIPAAASASLTVSRPHRWLDYTAWMIGAGTAGALIAGGRSRISGLLGGLLAGMVVAQHIHQSGRDFKLHSGQIVRVRLSADLEKQ